jgi:signal transduction histidine kinase
VIVARALEFLPRGNLLDDEVWRRRHTVVQTLLVLHVPALALFGWWQGFSPLVCAEVVAISLACWIAGQVIRHRRIASFFTTAGLVWCSISLVGFSHGTIEAHFHFFIIIGFIALYQDWVPFLWNIVFTVLSHGIGSAWQSNLIFNHPSALANPWVWSGIHGAAVLFACVGMVIFWRTTEDEQRKTLALTRELANSEVNRRKFTSDLLVNLARRNQSLIYRQLDIINQLEEHERDADALAWLFQLDHLATRVRRNAESLLVLSGEDPPRVWSKPVRLIDVVRAAIAETEELSRVAFIVDDRPAVLGEVVADMTHLLAELTENAVRFSPPQTRVTIRSAPDPMSPGTCVLTVEDWGVGMPADDVAAANELLTAPRDVDLSVSRRLGLHVVARLAVRHGIRVTLGAPQGAGLTAIVALPASVFARPARHIARDDDGLATPRAMADSVRAFSPPMSAASVVSPGFAGAGGRRAEAPLAQVIDVRDEAVAPPPLPVRSRPELNGHRPPGPSRPEPRYHADPPDVIVPLPCDRVGPERVVPERVRPEPDATEPVFPEPMAPEPIVDRAPDPQPERRPAPMPERAPEPDAAPSTGRRPARSPLPFVPRRPEPVTDPPGEGGRGGPVLARRIPQANLAPELRRNGVSPASPSTPVAVSPDAARARDALSRYQASRRAALRGGAQPGVPHADAGGHQ